MSSLSLPFLASSPIHTGTSRRPQQAKEAHRKRQDELRAKLGPDYRNDLDLIFANPDPTPLNPDSISATVSALFNRLKNS